MKNSFCKVIGFAAKIKENPTKRPVSRKHVGEVGDNVEGGIDDIGHREVDKEVVGHWAHPLVRHNDPDYWKSQV